MHDPDFLDNLVGAEVRRIVAAQGAVGGILRSDKVVGAVKRTYPKLPFSDRELENRVIAAASQASIPVEMGGAAISAQDGALTRKQVDE